MYLNILWCRTFPFLYDVSMAFSKLWPVPVIQLWPPGPNPIAIPGGR